MLSMVTKELLKTEIDNVQDEYLEILYKVIKAFESSSNMFNQTKDDTELNWHAFIQETYGCLADAPIERGSQGEDEIREIIE